MIDTWATVPSSVAEVTSAVEQITGRPPRRFIEWAADHAATFK